MKNKGFTLAEVLVSMAIFSMVLGAVVAVYIKGMQIYRQKGEDVHNFRALSITFENISKDIMCNAEEILYPSARQDKRPNLYDGASFMVFSTYDHKIISYQFDDKKLVIWKILYKNFNKNKPAESQLADKPPEKIAQGVYMLDFMLHENIMQIYMIAEKDLKEPKSKKYKFLTKIESRAKIDTGF